MSFHYLKQFTVRLCCSQQASCSLNGSLKTVGNVNLHTTAVNRMQDDSGVPRVRANRKKVTHKITDYGYTWNMHEPGGFLKFVLSFFVGSETKTCNSIQILTRYLELKTPRFRYEVAKVNSTNLEAGEAFQKIKLTRGPRKKLYLDRMIILVCFLFYECWKFKVRVSLKTCNKKYVRNSERF